MFECKTCKALQTQLELSTKEKDRLMALVERLAPMINPSAWIDTALPQPFNPADYYGNEHDEMLAYDEFGQPITVQQKK